MKQLKKIRNILLLVVLTGCYYDNEENLYAQVSPNCDLENVTYNATVKPIIQASCLACHSNSKAANSGGGIKLENFADVQTQAKNGKLMGTIKHSSGYQEMPLGGGKLPDCEINKLQKWIDNGILNN